MAISSPGSGSSPLSHPPQLQKMNPLCPLFAAVPLLGLVCSCGDPVGHQHLEVSAGAYQSRVQSGDLDDRLHERINRYRRSIGKEAIARHRGLDQMAMNHCRFMASNRGKFNLGSTNITHYGLEERAIFAQRAYGMQMVAENVAGGYMKGDLADGVARSWIQSPGHLFNLRSEWDLTGIATIVTPDGMVYATQIFATCNGSATATSDRFRQF